MGRVVLAARLMMVRHARVPRNLAIKRGTMTVEVLRGVRGAGTKIHRMDRLDSFRRTMVDDGILSYS